MVEHNKIHKLRDDPQQSTGRIIPYSLGVLNLTHIKYMYMWYPTEENISVLPISEGGVGTGLHYNLHLNEGQKPIRLFHKNFFATKLRKLRYYLSAHHNIIS
ncbi:hypothetical protein ACJX0J_011374, partial [Zea mays]